jgi:hypothetical protein
MTAATRRLGLCLALGLACVPLVTVRGQPTAQPPAAKNEYYKGKVRPLAEVLDKQGAKLDADAAATWFALVTDDGKIYPLVKDDGSRMFFTDKRLLNRPMRLTARQVPGTQMLQVVHVHSYLKGELHEVYYWCDVCAIRAYEDGKCACCGDPMVLKEVPVRD